MGRKTIFFPGRSARHVGPHPRCLPPILAFSGGHPNTPTNTHTTQRYRLHQLESSVCEGSRVSTAKSNQSSDDASRHDADLITKGDLDSYGYGDGAGAFGFGSLDVVRTPSRGPNAQTGDRSNGNNPALNLGSTAVEHFPQRPPSSREPGSARRMKNPQTARRLARPKSTGESRPRPHAGQELHMKAVLQAEKWLEDIKISSERSGVEPTHRKNTSH